MHLQQLFHSEMHHSELASDLHVVALGRSYFNSILIYLFARSLSKRKLLNGDTDMSCADKPTVGGLPPIIPFRLEVPITVALSLPNRLRFCHSSQVKTALCRSVRCYLGTSILWWIRGCVWSDDAGVGEAFAALGDRTELLLLLKLLIIPSVVFD